MNESNSIPPKLQRDSLGSAAEYDLCMAVVARRICIFHSQENGTSPSLSNKDVRDLELHHANGSDCQAAIESGAGGGAFTKKKVKPEGGESANQIGCWNLAVIDSSSAGSAAP